MLKMLKMLKTLKMLKMLLVLLVLKMLLVLMKLTSTPDAACQTNLAIALATSESYTEGDWACTTAAYTTAASRTHRPIPTWDMDRYMEPHITGVGPKIKMQKIKMQSKRAVESSRICLSKVHHWMHAVQTARRILYISEYGKALGVGWDGRSA